MVKDHTKDVNEFRRESQSAKNPDVKAFAAQTLPTLEDHLSMAKQDRRAVATTGTKPARTKKKGGK
jgi:putative membrane protein